MSHSGIDPSGLRRLIGTSDFAHGLIDYIVSNEPLLLAVASENQMKPESITAVWAKLHHFDG
jgi:hypothetical protein